MCSHCGFGKQDVHHDNLPYDKQHNLMSPIHKKQKIYIHFAFWFVTKSSMTFVQVISQLPCEINILILFFFATVFRGVKKTVKISFHTELIAKSLENLCMN